eukprot:Em0001g1132a
MVLTVIISLTIAPPGPVKMEEPAQMESIPTLVLVYLATLVTIVLASSTIVSLNLVSVCTANYCENGGTCSVTLDTNIQCKCSETTKGDKCQYNRQCLFQPCANGGTCNDEVTMLYTCSCPSTYGGTNCTERVCTIDYCFNGGVCFIDSSSNALKCSCPDNVKGYRCEHDYRTDKPISAIVSDARTDIGEIAGSVVAVVFLLILSIVALLVYRRCRIKNGVDPYFENPTYEMLLKHEDSIVGQEGRHSKLDQVINGNADSRLSETVYTILT